MHSHVLCCPAGAEEFGIALAGPVSHLVQGVFWLFLGAEMVPVCASCPSPPASHPSTVTADSCHAPRHPLAALTSSSSPSSVGSPPSGSSDYAQVVSTDFWLALCSFALLLQFLLFWLNVTLPVYPLDGGRLMVATLSYLGVGLESAAYITAGMGLFSGGLILLYGLLGSATTTALGIWVVYEAYNLRRKAASGEADFHPLFANYAGGPPGQLPSYAPPGQFPTPPSQGMGMGMGGMSMGGPPPYVADGGVNKGMNAPSGTYGAL